MRRRDGQSRLRRTIPLIVVAVSLSTSVRSASAGDFGYTFGGDCEELTIFAPFDARTVREETPGLAPFTMPGEASGQVLGIIGQGHCTGVKIDGEAAQDFTFSEVGVAIASPDGTDGNHAYNLWNFVDLAALHARSCRLGACYPLVEDLPFRLSEIVPGVTSIEASAERAGDRYSVSATILDAPAAGVGNHTATTWKSGRHGRVRTGFALTGELDAGGPGALRAEPGTPLARMLGAEVVHTEVFLRRFHFEATARLPGS